MSEFDGPNDDDYNQWQHYEGQFDGENAGSSFEENGILPDHFSEQLSDPVEIAAADDAPLTSYNVEAFEERRPRDSAESGEAAATFKASYNDVEVRLSEYTDMHTVIEDPKQYTMVIICKMEVPDTEDNVSVTRYAEEIDGQARHTIVVETAGNEHTPATYNAYYTDREGGQAVLYKDVVPQLPEGSAELPRPYTTSFTAREKLSRLSKADRVPLYQAAQQMELMRRPVTADEATQLDRLLRQAVPKRYSFNEVHDAMTAGVTSKEKIPLAEATLAAFSFINFATNFLLRETSEEQRAGKNNYNITIPEEQPRPDNVPPVELCISIGHVNAVTSSVAQNVQSGLYANLNRTEFVTGVELEQHLETLYRDGQIGEIPPLTLAVLITNNMLYPDMYLKTAYTRVLYDGHDGQPIGTLEKHMAPAGTEIVGVLRNLLNKPHA